MKIGVLTGGGDCPGLNPCIRGVVMRAMDYNDEVIGIKEGWAGLLEKNFTPLSLKDVEEIVDKGGTIIGTSRANPEKVKDGIAKCIANFKDLGLDALIAIGGNDTLKIAKRLHENNIPVVGVPKTMDNDLSGTDYTFGFDSSVAVAVDALARLKDTASSHQRVFIYEVMGRHVGWVALFTAIAGGADWVVLPEMTPKGNEYVELVEKLRKDGKSTEEIEKDEAVIKLKKEAEQEKEDQILQIISRIQAVRKRGKRYAIIVVSEGVNLIGVTGQVEERDAHGNIILKERGVADSVAREIESRFKSKGEKVETRTAVIGHIQRGGAPTIFDRILSLRVGVKAVDYVHEGKFGKMVALCGNEITLVDIEKALELKVVPQDWVKFGQIFFK